QAAPEERDGVLLSQTFHVGGRRHRLAGRGGRRRGVADGGGGGRQQGGDHGGQGEQQRQQEQQAAHASALRRSRAPDRSTTKSDRTHPPGRIETPARSASAGTP